MHPHRSSALGHMPPPLQRRTAGCTCGCACAACAAQAAASEALRLRVGGCIRAWRDFGPYPVFARLPHDIAIFFTPPTTQRASRISSDLSLDTVAVSHLYVTEDV